MIGPNPVTVKHGSAVIPDDDLSIFVFADLIRRAEEETLRLYQAGHIAGTVHTCIGQEISQLAVARALAHGDSLFSTHRNHGHLLAYSGDFAGFFAELTGREGALCGGRGGSQHMVFKHFHSNGVQGGMTGIAAGFALAAKLSRTDAIAAVVVGDGTLGEGLLYEAMNLAGVFELPILFVIENNQIAQTTPIPGCVAASIEARGAAFGLQSLRLNDNDASFVRKVQDFVGRVRRSGKPHFLVIDTQRLGPHSKGDDLRDAAELRILAENDPLYRLRGALSGFDLHEIETRNASFIRDLSQSVLSRPLAAETEKPSRRSVGPAPRTAHSAPLSVRESLNSVLHRTLREHDDVVLLGEDLHDPYGGAFKVTKGLSTAFPERVLSTPISEGAIIGATIGLAMAGKKPVAEIMFADFLSLCVDQLYNHASKLTEIAGSPPLAFVVRAATGGRRGYGPTHSQCPEGLLASIPGLTIVVPNHRCDPGRLLDAAILRANCPVLFLEHKLLYGLTIDDEHYQELEPTALDDLTSLFPTLIRPAPAPDLTILTYGHMLTEAESAAAMLSEHEELSVEIIALSLISPLPMEAILAKLQSCKRLIIAEEGPKAFGVGAEVSARILEAGLTIRVHRIGLEEQIIPAARHLELSAIPASSKIVSAALSLFEGVR